MEEEIEFLLDSLVEDMEKPASHLDKALLKLRAGRANPSMLEGVAVEYYGSVVKLTQVANINTPDARTLFVQPFEKGMIGPIEKAILNGNLGFNPQNNGEMIIINIPPLTEDRRRELVRMAKAEGEDAKVGIRAIRKNGMDEAKRLEKDGLSEDSRKAFEDDVQKMVDKYIAIVDSKVATKEDEIMKV
ncbi:MAG TPA: ribosome recycling factor [Cryomorphaceae bacterium]|jgi:ribosome recycling factor|nr:MAG: ribosome-recycling factor [Cryomorphaceae bacterium BACL7 MAG-120910-bin2]KRO69377.1 MAG: ribosome-recycling factor [Cryomorphaceae bacterium BACL7 MAG-120322-bin74]KRO83264.1 MAG: ribosome-recycling factor [Cryomorphaceae bacterium BACL7 MAG-121220-bin83]NQW25555.1 ribosome recycling factor [Cryomorphaceae bacterium]HAB31819.1 ribosome recycling factor [Cryomorphaceae bacterium]|tara:strand:+ start:388 stop:951 length:564 start_codon:yes stop_codon:yes gene_type:complete